MTFYVKEKKIMKIVLLCKQNNRNTAISTGRPKKNGQFGN